MTVACSREYTLTLKTNLVAYWALEQTWPDNLSDSSGNGFDLSAAFNYTSIPGKVGNGIQSSGNFDYLTVPLASAKADNPNLGFTLCGWAKVEVDLGLDGQIFSAYFSTYDIDFRIGPGSMMRFRWGVDDIEIAWPADGGWHFYRAWFDPADSKMRLQIDLGSILASGSIVRANATWSDFSLAGATTFSNNPSFDETGYWNRVLSDAEAASLWNGGAGTTFPNVP